MIAGCRVGCLANVARANGSGWTSGFGEIRLRQLLGFLSRKAGRGFAGEEPEQAGADQQFAQR